MQRLFVEDVISTIISHLGVTEIAKLSIVAPGEEGLVWSLATELELPRAIPDVYDRIVRFTGDKLKTLAVSHMRDSDDKIKCLDHVANHCPNIRKLYLGDHTLLMNESRASLAQIFSRLSSLSIYPDPIHKDVNQWEKCFFDTTSLVKGPMKLEELNIGFAPENAEELSWFAKAVSRFSATLKSVNFPLMAQSETLSDIFGGCESLTEISGLEADESPEDLVEILVDCVQALPQVSYNIKTTQANEWTGEDHQVLLLHVICVEYEIELQAVVASLARAGVNAQIPATMISGLLERLLMQGRQDLFMENSRYLELSNSNLLPPVADLRQYFTADHFAKLLKCSSLDDFEYFVRLFNSHTSWPSTMLLDWLGQEPFSLEFIPLLQKQNCFHFVELMANPELNVFSCCRTAEAICWLFETLPHEDVLKFFNNRTLSGPILTWISCNRWDLVDFVVSNLKDANVLSLPDHLCDALFRDDKPVSLDRVKQVIEATGLGNISAGMRGDLLCCALTGCKNSDAQDQFAYLVHLIWEDYVGGAHIEPLFFPSTDARFAETRLRRALTRHRNIPSVMHFLKLFKQPLLRQVALSSDEQHTQFWVTLAGLLAVTDGLLPPVPHHVQFLLHEMFGKTK